MVFLHLWKGLLKKESCKKTEAVILLYLIKLECVRFLGVFNIAVLFLCVCV